jgi:hypothetical protein
MPRGGDQSKNVAPGKKMGRPEKPKIPLSATTGIASRVLAAAPDKVKDGWPGEEKRWLELLNAKDDRLRFDVQKYLTDRRDGKPAQGVFVGDTRESGQALNRGNLPSHFRKTESADIGGTGKPN